MNDRYEDRESRIIKYLPLVKKIVGKINPKDNIIDQEDLFNMGVIGLMDAIDKYDKSKEVPFEAYASLRIRGSVIDELRKMGKVSRDKIDKLNEYYQTKSDLETALMRTPKEGEIVQRLGIDDKQLSKIHETVHYLSSISLEATLSSTESGDFLLIDSLEDHRTIKPEESLIDNEMKEALVRAIRELDERDQTILNLYYVEDLSLKEIAYILDISAPRVSQLHGRILLKLRSILEP